jgi:hypothetical protein
MRKWLLILTLAAGLLNSTGCLLNQYPQDPNQRMDVLLNHSEDLRQINNEVRRFWMNDQPSHMTYERIHGGIGPG